MSYLLPTPNIWKMHKPSPCLSTWLYVIIKLCFIKLMHSRSLAVITLARYISYKSLQFSQVCYYKWFISIINHYPSYAPLTLQCFSIQHTGVGGWWFFFLVNMKIDKWMTVLMKKLRLTLWHVFQLNGSCKQCNGSLLKQNSHHATESWGW